MRSNSLFLALLGIFTMLNAAFATATEFYSPEIDAKVLACP